MPPVTGPDKPEEFESIGQQRSDPTRGAERSGRGKVPDPKHCTVLHRRPLIPSSRLSDRSPVEVVLDLSHDGCIRGEIQFKETDERIKLFVKPNRT